MRHPKEGAPVVASGVSRVPIINAGDGGHFHPTQTLTDLFTIKEKCGRLDGLTVGVCGDLKYGRTVHSLIAALARYENITVVLISPNELRIPDYVKDDIIVKSNMNYRETTSLEDAMPDLDVLYMTRIQRERFSDKDEYERLKDSYVLTPEKLITAKEDMCILHPLPRVNEISVKVDEDKRASYFRQALNGKYMRMALILKLLSEVSTPKEQREGEGLVYDEIKCENARCITSTEQELTHIFRKDGNGDMRCIYCEALKK
jgi:aspartate carbamoyltransferase catalytic subunit